MPNLFFIKDIKKSNSSCDFYDGEKKYIATADLQDGKIVNYELVAFNNKPSRANLIAEKGSVIFAKMQNTIKVLEINESNMDNIYSTGFYSFKDERIIPSYLKFFFESDVFNIIKDKNCQGATMKAINDEGMSKISINVPTIQKQQKIITELSKITDLININRKNLFNLDIIVKSQFIEMFGDPSFVQDGHTFKETAIKLVRGPFGSSLKKEFFVPNDVNTYKVYEQKHAIEDNEEIGSYYINEKKYKELERFSVEPGDIIMSCSGTIGRTHIISDKAKRGVINQALLLIRLNRKKCNEIFFINQMKMIINNLSTSGSAIVNISSIKILSEMNFLIPPIELQNKFADFVQQIDKSKYMLLEILVIAIIQTES